MTQVFAPPVRRPQAQSSGRGGHFGPRGGDGGGEGSGDSDRYRHQGSPNLICVAYLGELPKNPGARLYALGTQSPPTTQADMQVKNLIALGPGFFHSPKINNRQITGRLEWFTHTSETYAVIACPFDNKKGLLSPHGFVTIPFVTLESTGELNHLINHAAVFPQGLNERLTGYFEDVESAPLAREHIRPEHLRGYIIVQGVK